MSLAQTCNWTILLFLHFDPQAGSNLPLYRYFCSWLRCHGVTYCITQVTKSRINCLAAAGLRLSEMVKLKLEASLLQAAGRVLWTDIVMDDNDIKSIKSHQFLRTS